MGEIELVDIADNLLILNQTTVEKLFQEKNQNVLVLYLFYYKTAKWQKHNPIKATDDYCKKCLHWGIDKLQQAKKRLKEINLIETIRRIDDKGVVAGWFIKVNYLVDESRIPVSTIPISPDLGKQETNTINNNNKILFNNKNITTTVRDSENLYDFLEKNGFVLTPIHYEIIEQWTDNELTRYAIKQAVLNNKYNINYIDKILYSYKRDNIQTVQQAIEREEEFNKRKDLYYKQKYANRENDTPKWFDKDLGRGGFDDDGEDF